MRVFLSLTLYSSCDRFVYLLLFSSWSSVYRRFHCWVSITHGYIFQKQKPKGWMQHRPYILMLARFAVSWSLLLITVQCSHLDVQKTKCTAHFFCIWKEWILSIHPFPFRQGIEWEQDAVNVKLSHNRTGIFFFNSCFIRCVYSLPSRFQHRYLHLFYCSRWFAIILHFFLFTHTHIQTYARTLLYLPFTNPFLWIFLHSI